MTTSNFRKYSDILETKRKMDLFEARSIDKIERDFKERIYEVNERKLQDIMAVHKDMAEEIAEDVPEYLSWAKAQFSSTGTWVDLNEYLNEQILRWLLLENAKHYEIGTQEWINYIDENAIEMNRLRILLGDIK